MRANVSHKKLRHLNYVDIFRMIPIINGILKIKLNKKNTKSTLD